MTENPIQDTELISLAEASKYSGLTHDFLTKLAKRGRLQAKKIGRNWVTTRAAVDDYLQSRSPVGRKPKSQKDI